MFYSAAIKVNKKSLKCGFSLIEMVIVITIIGISLPLLSQIFGIIFQSYQKVKQQSGLTYLVDTALQQMTNETRLAFSPDVTSTATIITLKLLRTRGEKVYSISYVCNIDTGQITRHTTESGENLLVNQVSACDFTVAPSTATRGELVKIIITLTNPQRNVNATLFQQIVINKD